MEFAVSSPELYEVVAVEKVSPTRVVTARVCVLASNHDEAVQAVKEDVPAENGENSRTFEVQKTREHRLQAVRYSFSKYWYESPVFSTKSPLATTGERLLLVTVRGHNPSLGKRDADFSAIYLTVASGYDNAVEVAQRPGGPGVTFRYEVRDWPGRIYEISREILNPELENEFATVYLRTAAARLLRRVASGLNLRRVADRQYEDGEGKPLKSTDVDSLVEFGLVSSTAEDSNMFTLTQKGLRYLEYISDNA